MDHTFGYGIAFDPKEDFPLSFSDRDDLSDFGEVTEVELKFVDLMDVVTHDNDWRQSRHTELVGLKGRANCSCRFAFAAVVAQKQLGLVFKLICLCFFNPSPEFSLMLRRIEVQSLFILYCCLPRLYRGSDGLELC